MLAVALLLSVLRVSTVAAADPGLIARLDVSFQASSTLHDFGGKAPSVDAAVDPEPGAPARWRADVDLPVASLDTGNAKRDAKMREMFQAEAFPVIRAALRDLDADAVRKDGHLDLTLTIRDVAHDVQADVTAWTAEGERVAFDASFDVSLAQYGLEAPRVLFIRVADRVHVMVHASVRRR